MRLTKHGSSWRAEGPDNHRARIAFATLDGDRLVYTFDGDLGRTQQRVTDSIAISSGSADLTSGSPSSLQAPSS